jgi:hypothetical protein
VDYPAVNDNLNIAAFISRQLELNPPALPKPRLASAFEA